MIFKYKGDEYEICARVEIEEIYRGCDLYDIDDKGNLTVTKDLFFEFDSPERTETIVWYEVSEMENESVVDKSTGDELYFIQIPTIEEAKRRIKLYKDRSKK